MVTENAMETKTPWWKDTTPWSWSTTLIVAIVLAIGVGLFSAVAFGGEGPDQDGMQGNDPGAAGGWGDVGAAAAAGAATGAVVGGQTGGNAGAATGAAVGAGVNALGEIAEQTFKCGGICGGGIDYQDGSSVGAIEGNAAEMALNQGSHPRQ